MPTVTLILPSGAPHTVSLPLHPQLLRQVQAGVLRYAEAAASPDVALDGNGDASRVEASPAVLSQPGEPVNPGQPVEGATDIQPPAGNASREEWAAFAVTQGMHPDEAGQLKREEIKARIVGSDTDSGG